MAMAVLDKYEGRLIGDLLRIQHDVDAHPGAVIQLVQTNIHVDIIPYPRLPISPVAGIYASTEQRPFSPVDREDPYQDYDVHQRQPPPEQAFLVFATVTAC